MYIVVKVANYDIKKTEATMFTTHKLAVEYMEWLWNEEYEKEKRRNETLLQKSDCFVEGDYAKINWIDHASIEFYVVKDSRPRNGG